ncbi:unnamed protein product [Notodromas monacha]|uniref:Uncharacterized protein n=1 Tax=Notodromas monacha TaxID=399045 RepID=A0A7R9BH14_9CRUS|nr:unnamed protein product [Notodromas monacha]CAG0914250.1 unnamed protein product [Notodromas monacha]
MRFFFAVEFCVASRWLLSSNETGDRAKNSSSSSNSKAGRRKRSWKNESSCCRSHCEEDGGSVMDMLLTLAMICVLATVFFEGARHWLLESDETATTTSSSSSSLEYEVDALRHEAKANKTGRRIPTATTTTAAQSKRVCTAKSSSESRPGESLEQGRRIMTRKKARRRRLVRERDWDDNNVDDGVFEEVVWTESVLKCWEECQRRTYCVNFVVRLSIGGVKARGAAYKLLGPASDAILWLQLKLHLGFGCDEMTFSFLKSGTVEG